MQIRLFHQLSRNLTRKPANRDEYRCKCGPSPLCASHTVCLSHCVALTLSVSYIVWLSHCVALTLCGSHTVCLSHCVPLTLSGSHTVCLSHCLALTLCASHTVCMIDSNTEEIRAVLWLETAWPVVLAAAPVCLELQLEPRSIPECLWDGAANLVVI